MSINQFPGGIVTKTPAAPTTSSAKGIWTLSQATGYAKQGIWPRIPSAPTIGTATAGSSGCASVTFTAPTCVGAGSLTYSVVSTPGCFSNTGASSPIVVSGLTTGTSYTFKAFGVTPGGTGPGSAASNSITAANQGSQSYTTAGTYSWVAPAGVTSVSVVAVGGGGGGGSSMTFTDGGGGSGGGGELRYKNNITVVPGNSYTVVVGAGASGQTPSGARQNGGCSTFATTTVVAKGGQGGSANSAGSGGSGGTGDGGGNGGAGFGSGGGAGGAGGGGAAGYSGNGGAGATPGGGSSAAPSGGGGSGAGGACPNSAYGLGGGGVGLLGQGASGGAAAVNVGGKGGSCGANGSTTGGAYGGGGGGARMSGICGSPAYSGRAGAVGAVRIIWPGNTRSFPSTNAGNP